MLLTVLLPFKMSGNTPDILKGRLFRAAQTHFRRLDARICAPWRRSQAETGRHGVDREASRALDSRF